MYRLEDPRQNIRNLKKYYPGSRITNTCSHTLAVESVKGAAPGKSIKKVVKAQGVLRLSFLEQ